MPRFILPPADTSWLDRAQSRDGRFDPALGFVLCELDGENYAVSGRYCGLPDTDETKSMVADLHCERGFGSDEELPRLTEQVSILFRFPGTCERKRYTVKQS